MDPKTEHAILVGVSALLQSSASLRAELFALRQLVLMDLQMRFPEEAEVIRSGWEKSRKEHLRLEETKLKALLKFLDQARRAKEDEGNASAS